MRAPRFLCLWFGSVSFSFLDTDSYSAFVIYERATAEYSEEAIDLKMMTSKRAKSNGKL